ncbi:MAG: hypothetical protein AAF702_26735 [Chloroflexota bacterium]
MKKTLFNSSYLLLMVLVSLLFTAVSSGCGVVDLPQVPEIPELPDIPGLPQSLDELTEQIPGILDELEIPDLSGIANLPDLSDLPGFTTEPGVISFQGPTEKRINIGETIPGTDIQLTSIDDQGANFQIAGYNSRRATGDSLDFDGGWSGLDGITYTVRLRIYRIGSESVRAAGVHQMVIQNIQPVAGPVPQHDQYLRVPFSIAANSGENLKGLTIGYVGSADRGGELSGLSGDEYPFRKIGDSISWEGTVRNDIPVRYSLRVLYYGANSIRVGGTVAVYLPGL